MDQSTSVKRRCDEEATKVVEENNASMGLYVVKSITKHKIQHCFMYSKRQILRGQANITGLNQSLWPWSSQEVCFHVSSDWFPVVFFVLVKGGSQVKMGPFGNMERIMESKERKTLSSFLY